MIRSAYLSCVIVSACVIGACDQSPIDSRKAQLQAFLHADNAVWITDEPGLLAEKYHRMAADPYDFMRGTVGLFYADVARKGQLRDETHLLQSPEAGKVLVVGDPHPENLGTIRGVDGELSLEWVDLDAASHGPYILDLRRAVLGLTAYAGEQCGADCQIELSAAVASSYRETITRWDTASPAPGPETGHLVQSLIDEAREEGQARKRLRKYTTVEGTDRVIELDAAVDCEGPTDSSMGETSMDAVKSVRDRQARTRASHREHRGPIEACGADGRWGDGRLRLSDAEKDEVGRLMALVRRKMGPDFRVLDVARRFGKGVSSLPARRYLVLWDRGADTPDDDELMNLRMVVEPPFLPGIPAGQTGLYAGNAARIDQISATLWGQMDPLAFGLNVGGHAFKSSSTSSWFQELDHEKAAKALRKMRANTDDLVQVARWVGHTLAETHSRGHLPDGRLSHPFIKADLGHAPEALAEDLARWQSRDYHQLMLDYDHFNALRREHGPLLGYERLALDIR